jgi:hypothetical protein
VKVAYLPVSYGSLQVVCRCPSKPRCAGGLTWVIELKRDCVILRTSSNQALPPAHHPHIYLTSTNILQIHYKTPVLLAHPAKHSICLSRTKPSTRSPSLIRRYVLKAVSWPLPRPRSTSYMPMYPAHRQHPEHLVSALEISKSYEGCLGCCLSVMLALSSRCALSRSPPRVTHW